MERDILRLEYATSSIIDKVVQISELGVLLEEASDLFVNHRERLTSSLRYKLEKIIKILESAFDGDDEIESWLIQNGKVRITRASIRAKFGKEYL